MLLTVSSISSTEQGETLKVGRGGKTKRREKKSSFPQASKRQEQKASFDPWHETDLDRSILFEWRTSELQSGGLTSGWPAREVMWQNPPSTIFSSALPFSSPLSALEKFSCVFSFSYLGRIQHCRLRCGLFLSILSLVFSILDISVLNRKHIKLCIFSGIGSLFTCIFN